MIFAQSLNATFAPENGATTPTTDDRQRAWEEIIKQSGTTAVRALAPVIEPTPLVSVTPTPMPTPITTTTDKPKSNLKTWLIVGGGITAALGILVFLARR